MKHSRSFHSSLLPLIALGTVFAADPIILTVDARSPIGEISSLIYGINHNDSKARPFIPFTRQGGNRMTAYNWENNASNSGNDWHHQNDDYISGEERSGEAVRRFLSAALAKNHTALITVPMAGYVAADKRGGGDVNQTPDFLNKRFVKSLPCKGSPFIYPPDKSDGLVYQDEFVWWLNREFSADKDRILYSLDNEPDLWDSTHPRLRTKKLTYAELVNRTIDTATAIKAVEPQAILFGFVSYGYAGFTTLQQAPDSEGRDFTDFFLDQMRLAEKTAGRRLVDALDLHWYPEATGGGKRITEKGDASTARARVQAPRSLWDPTYKEESWITRATGGPITLLPNLLAKIERHYPGTKLSFSEYDYGGGEHISGAVAQADLLGILGEHGIYAAALWGGGPFQYAAFDSFLNCDGTGGCYGDLALKTTTSDTEDVVIHASRFKADPNRLSLVLINRSESSRSCLLTVLGFDWAGGEAYRITAASPMIKPASRLNANGRFDLPAMSVTTVLASKKSGL